MRNIATRSLRQLLILLVLPPIFSCQQHSGDERAGDLLVLSGLWYNGPESSQFLPCEMYDPNKPSDWIFYGKGYWLDPSQGESAEFLEQINERSDVDIGYETVVQISIEARLSEVGRFGHLGQYEREVIPIKLIGIRATESCPYTDE